MATVVPGLGKKYDNGKSRLSSGMVTLAPLTRELNITNDTSAEDIVDWAHSIMKNIGGSIVKRLIIEKIEAVVLAKTSFHVKSYPMLESAGVEVSNDVEALVEWMIKLPKWDDYYMLAIEGVDKFINTKR